MYVYQIFHCILVNHVSVIGGFYSINWCCKLWHHWSCGCNADLLIFILGLLTVCRGLLITSHKYRTLVIMVLEPIIENLEMQLRTIYDLPLYSIGVKFLSWIFWSTQAISRNFIHTLFHVFAGSIVACIF